MKPEPLKKKIRFEILDNFKEEDIRKLLDKRLVQRKSDGITYRLKGKTLTIRFPEVLTYRVYHFFFIDQVIKVKPIGD